MAENLEAFFGWMSRPTTWPSRRHRCHQRCRLRLCSIVEEEHREHRRYLGCSRGAATRLGRELTRPVGAERAGAW